MRATKVYVQHEFVFLLKHELIDPEDVITMAKSYESMMVDNVKFTFNKTNYPRTLVVVVEGTPGSVICDLYGTVPSQ